MNTEIPDRYDKKAFAKHISTVTAAFAEGIWVQWKYKDIQGWDYPPLGPNDSPDWDWRNRDYRIAPTPQPTHEAWTFETAPTNVKVRRKHDGARYAARLVNDKEYYLPDEGRVTFADLLRDFEQLDGSPCGVKREEVEPEEYEHAYSEKRQTIFRRSRRDNGWEAMVLGDGQKWNRSRGQEPMSEFLASDFAYGEYAAIPAHEAHALIAKGGAK